MDFDSSIFQERRFLFQGIAKAFPKNPWVIKATEKMKSYSKEEYKKMLSEGYDLQNLFDKAVAENIKIDSEECRYLFNLFIKHIEWFFDINQDSYNELIELCKPNNNQFLIVNKNYSDMLLDMLLFYRSTLEV